jgi:uncharacterized protein (DUF433 family)
MPERKLSLSVSEVAALSGVSEKIVRNEIHRGIILSGKRRAQRKHWRFSPDAVAYFMLFSKMPFPKEDRQAVYELLATDKRRAGNWRKSHQGTLDRDGFLSLNTKRLLSDSNRKLRLYKQGLRRIESRPEILSGEEVFQGTRLSVRHIGGMVRKGVTIEDVKADYPTLTTDDVRFAEIYSAVKRPPGRPTKLITFRRNSLD